MRNASFSLEHLAEILPEVVAGGPLDSPTRSRYVCLDSGGFVTPREFLSLRFCPCQEVKLCFE